MKTFKFTVLFLVINFGALALGTWLMNNGPMSSWYINLNKAPWTPPGWVFGIAWTSIMFCFSVFMAYLYNALPNKKIIALFLLQFILNISWNYAFFNKHFVFIGFIIISLLTFTVALFTFGFKKQMAKKILLVIPYLIWLCIATSLNTYILLYN